jgi:hypothetical protein
VKDITVAKGSAREMTIFHAPHELIKGHTWNDDHKVVTIVTTHRDSDGHADSYDVDIVTRTICG